MTGLTIDTKTLLAWRLLSHEPGRSGLAVGGVFVAVLLVFLQLGLYFCVPKGGMLHYDAMRFDLVVTAASYEAQANAQSFPRRRLSQLRADPEIATVAPLYQDAADWLDPLTGRRQEIFVMAFEPERPVFAVDSIQDQVAVLGRPDTVLVDDANASSFGAANPGDRVEIAGREVTLGGRYTLGPGFVGQGVVLASDQQFARFFPQRGLTEVSIGLIQLAAGVDPERAAARLRQTLPADVLVMTRAELTEREVRYWTTCTSTGLVFGSGAVVGFVVGAVILYQVLASQILRALPQYATLKAMGYGNGYLGAVVVRFAALLAVLAYGPALLAALAGYALIRHLTLLPVDMTADRALLVLAGTLVMTVGAAWASLRAVRRADPVDLF